MIHHNQWRETVALANLYGLMGWGWRMFLFANQVGEKTILPKIRPDVILTPSLWSEQNSSGREEWWRCVGLEESRSGNSLQGFIVALGLRGKQYWWHLGFKTGNKGWGREASNNGGWCVIKGVHIIQSNLI